MDFGRGDVLLLAFRLAGTLFSRRDYCHCSQDMTKKSKKLRSKRETEKDRVNSDPDRASGEEDIECLASALRAAIARSRAIFWFFSQLFLRFCGFVLAKASRVPRLAKATYQTVRKRFCDLILPVLKLRCFQCVTFLVSKLHARRADSTESGESVTKLKRKLKKLEWEFSKLKQEVRLSSHQAAARF